MSVLVTQAPVVALTVPGVRHARVTQAPVVALTVPGVRHARVTQLAVECLVGPRPDLSDVSYTILFADNGMPSDFAC